MMRNREIVSGALCFLGCVLLVPACWLLGCSKVFYLGAVVGLIIACSCLVLAAFLEVYPLYISTVNDRNHSQQQLCYAKHFQLLGASLFLLASCLYLPLIVNRLVLGMSVADYGTWVFRFGSCAYLASSFLCLKTILANVEEKESWLKSEAISVIALICFILGSLFYIAGGVVAQMKINPAWIMAMYWVLGSVGFAVGSFLFLRMMIARNMGETVVNYKLGRD